MTEPSRRALQAEARRTEILIGELLGAPEPGKRTDLQPLETFKGLDISYRSTFRFFAANAQLANQLVDNGVTRRSHCPRIVNGGRVFCASPGFCTRRSGVA